MSKNYNRKQRYPELIDPLAYERDGVLIITMPLKMKGYYCQSKEAGAFITVKSELPRAERSRVINWGLKQHKQKLAEAKNAR